MGKVIDLTGQRFGMLTAIECIGRDKQGLALWKCKCDCGEICEISSGSLRGGYRRNCGNHMEYRNHKMIGTKLYNSYSAILQRCYDKNSFQYPYYGGRGIKICEEWLDKKDGRVRFMQWALSNGYKEWLSLDRIDVNGDYCPDNCRWVTKSIQSFNQRKRKSASGIRGVYYRESTKRYLVRIGIDNKDIFLGSYKTKEEAINARRNAEIKYYGQALND